MTPPAGRRKVTLLDVARRASVDRSVVSRVLSGDPRLNVRDETRARVLAAVAELGYQPNAMARSLRTQRAEAFGLVIPDYANPVYAAIIRGAEAAAADHGCLLLTGSLTSGGFAAGQYVDLLGHGRVDGLLLGGAEAVAPPVEQLERLGLPWLQINRRSPESRRYVILDDARAAAMAVGHLAELGHRRIAHLAGPRDADTAQRRRAGYLQAMARCGLTVADELVVEGTYVPDGGAAAMRRLLELEPRPTAVFVANAAAAIGALAAARQHGVAVPRDVSVVAVHDLPFAEYLEPPLTTIHMGVEELGRRAIALLVEAPADAPITETVTGGMRLVERRSTAPPAAT